MFKDTISNPDTEYEAISLRFVKRRGGKFDVFFVLEDAVGSRSQRIVSNRVLSIATEEAVDALLGLQIEVGRNRIKLAEQKAGL